MKSTKRYTLFKTIKGNRVLNDGHLKKLEKSILKVNMLPFYPITVNKNNEIIDGQHRLEVAKRNNLEIYYQIVQDSGLDEVITLNTNNRAWTSGDYLESYISQGFSQYIVLKNFMQRYELTLSCAIQLLMTGDKAIITSNFRQGLLDVSNRENGEIMGQRLLDLKPYLEDKNIRTSKDFISALTSLYKKGVTHEKLLRKLEITGIKIKKVSKVRGYLQLFEDLLNFHTKEDNWIRLY